MNIPATLVLLAANGKKSFLRIVMIGTVINLTFNIILVQIWDAMGTVISILVTELFITAGLYWEVYRLYIRGRREPENFLDQVFMKVNK
jgi:PST family polysaccharide transporter